MRRLVITSIIFTIITVMGVHEAVDTLEVLKQVQSPMCNAFRQWEQVARQTEDGMRQYCGD